MIADGNFSSASHYVRGRSVFCFFVPRFFFLSFCTCSRPSMCSLTTQTERKWHGTSGWALRLRVTIWCAYAICAMVAVALPVIGLMSHRRCIFVKSPICVWTNRIAFILSSHQTENVADGSLFIIIFLLKMHNKNKIFLIAFVAGQPSKSETNFTAKCNLFICVWMKCASTIPLAAVTAPAPASYTPTAIQWHVWSERRVLVFMPSQWAI